MNFKSINHVHGSWRRYSSLDGTKEESQDGTETRGVT